MYDNLVERTFQLSRTMCVAARMHLHTTVAVVNDQRQVLAHMAGWAGGPPVKESRASIIGPMKALELMIDLSGPMSMTPTEGLPMGCGYLGGVRRRSGDDPSIHFITSGSAWSGECDAQFAPLLSYSMSYEVRFHHVGFRHPTREAMLAVVEADEIRLGTSAIYVPGDHERYYLREVDHWVEHQYHPNGPYNHATHWDVATSDALGLLDFIAGHLNSAPRTWEAGPNDPVGATWEDNRDGVPLGVMTRPVWWAVA